MTGVEVLVAVAIAIGLVGVIVPVLPGSLLVLGAILRVGLGPRHRERLDRCSPSRPRSSGSAPS